MYNFNFLQALIGSVNEDMIDTVLKKDAKLNSCDAKRYVKENKLGYLTVISSWSALIPGPADRVLLLETVKKHGLLKTIEYSKSADLAVLSSELPDPTNPLAALVQRMLITKQTSEQGQALPYTELLKINYYVKALHQVLAYPSRYTPVYAPFLDVVTWSKFKAAQKALRADDDRKRDDCYRPGSNYRRFGREIQDVILTALPWKKIIREVKRLLENPKLYLSNGSCAKVGKLKGNKIVHLVERYPELGFSMFGTNTSFIAKDDPYDTVSQGYVVPKNSSTKRFIAAEDVYRQMICLGVFRILDPYLETLGIDLHDQEKQRNLCYNAAATGVLATTDVTGASDSITHQNFADFFPAEFIDLVSPYLPTSVSITIDGKVQSINLASRMTMGNAITFACECIIFWAADEVAYRTYEKFSGEKLNRYIELNGEFISLPGIYGDDQVHHSVVSTLVYDILDAIGFNVNREKSYSGDHPFREACGAEWYGALDITPCRFPRRAVRGEWSKDRITLSNVVGRDSRSDGFYDSLMTLISLQKELIKKGLTASADVVTAIITTAEPRMTFSPINTECCDCWGYALTEGKHTEYGYQFTSDLCIDGIDVKTGKQRTVFLTKAIAVELLRSNPVVQALVSRNTANDTIVGARSIDVCDEDPGYGLLANLGITAKARERRRYVTIPPTGISPIEEFHVDPNGHAYVVDKTTRYYTLYLVKGKCVVTDKHVRVLTQHLTPTVKRELSKDKLSELRNDPLVNASLDLWRYLYFLQFGPAYEHAADDPQGIFERKHSITSDRWRRGTNKSPDAAYYEALFGTPVITWEVKAEI